MEKFTEAVKNIRVYRGLAERIFPNGSIIRCRYCDVERKCSPEEIAYWLENGFPLCKKCGKRTDLVNPYKERILL